MNYRSEGSHVEETVGAKSTVRPGKTLVFRPSTPGWARTINLRFRRPMLYPIELQVQQGELYCLALYWPSLFSFEKCSEIHVSPLF
jgi:hypothetical protein